jgi:Kip1 ubiquitination-promoting complex protein 1
LAAFESNEAAVQRLPKALLSAFDQRSWIPVTNILLRLCRSSGFGSSKYGESSSSSVGFQVNSDNFFLDYSDFLFVARYLFSSLSLLQSECLLTLLFFAVGLFIHKEIDTGSLHQ